jgi:hypothetical protein
MPMPASGAFCLLLAALGAAVAQAEDVSEELKACARMSDHDRRIACYEALGARVLNEDAATSVERTSPSVNAAPPQPAAPQAAPAVAATEQLPEDLGGRKFRKPAKEETTQDMSRGHIIACARSFDNKWLFTFEDGQIWKETDSSRTRYSDCDFQASISKDYFGYKMQIDGAKGKIRISRVQ